MRKTIAAILAGLLLLLSAFASVAATEVGATSIAFDNYSIVMSPGGTYTIKVTLTPSDAKTSSLIWSCDDTRVATVTNGTVYSKLNGGCIVTATDPITGASARCYVGVGAPYGYTMYSAYDYYYNPYNYPYGGYYNGNYPLYTTSDYTYYDPYYYGYGGYYNNYNYSSYAYPYGYYSAPYYSNGSYYSSPVFYDYYSIPNNYLCYTNPYGQLVYSTVKPNPVDYVAPGTAVNASQFAQEVKQGVEVRLGDEGKGFGYVDAGNRLIVAPDAASATKTNLLQFAGNVLNRLERFKYEAIQYNLPNLEVSLFPALNKSVPTVLKVTGQPDIAPDNTVAGPWKVEVNSDAKGLGLRFILDKEYAKADLALMMLNADGKFVEIKRSEWTLTSQKSAAMKIFAVHMNDLPAGTYAVVHK